ncbi:MAG TPA: hypothetical protein VLO11_13030, partial [Luteolibacter sp.]|nr:hypothetical protein [Luteolibacter sp.]
GPRPVERLASWNQYEVGPGLHLAAHPELNVTQARGNGLSITLLGFILDPDAPDHDDAGIVGRLALEARPGISPLDLARRFGGRWLMIIAGPDDVKIFGDPAGLQQLFHTDAAATGVFWAASEPGILAEILGFGISPEAREFMSSEAYARNAEHWWPWDTSPYREIRRLPPNHELSVGTGAVRRFWPDKGFTPSTPDKAAEVVGETLRGLITAMHARCPLAVTLTAGLDSRMVLAAARPVARDVLFVTSKKRDMLESDPDLVISRRLAATLSLQHRIIDSDCQLREDFRELYFSSNQLCHEKWVFGAQAIHDALNLDKAAVGGHVAEVARRYYIMIKSGLDGEEDFTPELLARATGLGQSALVVRAMERWKDGLGEVYNHDARDLLYWENRLGSWLASSQQEFLLAWNKILSPFNCRRVLEAALSVDPELRGGPDYPFFRSVIARLWPECLDLPINPKPPVPLARRVRRVGRRILKKLFK